MASSVVELVNNALVELGETDLITDIAENTKAAILANQKYEAVRDAVLRAYPWNCAIERVVLAPASPSPIYNWTYRALLPPDCLRVLGLEEEADQWEIEGRYLNSHTDVMRIKYIKKITDVTVMDALLAEAISSRLAHALSYGLTQSSSMREAMWENYRSKLREARSIDAQEGMARQVEASEFLDARSGYRVKDLRKPV